MSGDGTRPRCAVCDFLITEGEPVVTTDIGYTHPLCAVDDGLLEP